MQDRKLIESAADGSMTIHCTQIIIKQLRDNGIILNGHGTIKINKVGTIYLEFICMKTESLPSFTIGIKFPEDPFDPKQMLHLEAIDLNGRRFTSQEFSLQIDTLFEITPCLIHVFLHKLHTESEYPIVTTQKHVYIELQDKLSVPKNKSNTYESSRGDKGWSWNEAIIKDKTWELSLVATENKVEINVKGSFDPENIIDAILFYVGLTSGALPQPHAIVITEHGITKTVIRSVNTKYRNQQLPTPIPENVEDPEPHYDVLRAIVSFSTTRQAIFLSARAQWYRLWHAFNSENNIANLTLGIAIEGLLNDIFIPVLSQESNNEELNTAKRNAISKINSTDLPDEQLKTITTFINNWGKITPKSALKILESKKLVSTLEITNWAALRNSSAHPRYQENTEERKLKDFKRTTSCLNLFYRLILNSFCYDGPTWEFSLPMQRDLSRGRYINILYERAAP